MIRITGYGIYIVLAIFGGSFLAFKTLGAHASVENQSILLIIQVLGATLLSTFILHHLNRNGVKHKLYEVPLEYAVLVVGGAFTILFIITAFMK